MFVVIYLVALIGEELAYLLLYPLLSKTSLRSGGSVFMLFLYFLL